MPIYEYQCASCGVRLEKLQKVSDKPLTQCPSCDKPALQKLVSAAAFHLKGSGWYVTDFKDKPQTKDSKDKADAKTAQPAETAKTGNNTDTTDTKTGTDNTAATAGKEKSSEKTAKDEKS
ncbi:MAG: zinc ribbon domain-containing protein [Gammaproteobacteria bacterium]